jgi:3D (Asp-Asp-Asp) domain-containing protein
MLAFITNFSFIVSIARGVDGEVRSNCTNGWHITAYFTPLESDYKSTRMKTLNVEGYGKVTLNDAFLKQVVIEGFGKTKEGWYISYWTVGPHWHRTEADKGPLDELDNKLVIGQTVAVDPKIISFESKLTIPTLPSPWNTKTFIATDVGDAIIGKHIDVYVGQGLAARDETFRITGYDNTVCL